MGSNNYNINIKMIFADPKLNSYYISLIEQKLSQEALQIINTFPINEITEVYEIFGCLNYSFMNQIESFGMLIIYFKNSNIQTFSIDIDDKLFYNKEVFYNENNKMILNHEIIKFNQYLPDDLKYFPSEYFLQLFDINIIK